jgi:hypothetical protein
MSANFHIQSQQAGVINQADQLYIDGGQHVSTNHVFDATRAVRMAVLQSRMTESARADAIRHLDKIENELHRPDPDRRTMGRHLGDLAAVLAAAGTFATAGASLVGSISAIAGLVGRFGNRALEIVRGATSV